MKRFNNGFNGSRLKVFSCAAILSGLLIGNVTNAEDVSNWTQLKNALDNGTSNIRFTHDINRAAEDVAHPQGNNYIINLNNFTLTSEYGESDVPILNMGGVNTFNLSNGTISGVYTTAPYSYGGAVYIIDAINVAVNNVVFSNNAVANIEPEPSNNRGSGFGAMSPNLTVANSIFENNGVRNSQVVTPYAGAAYLEGLTRGNEYNSVVTSANTTYTRNKALYDGGALMMATNDASDTRTFTYNINSGTATFADSQSRFEYNEAGRDGGAVYYNVTAEADLNIENTTFYENSAGRNGGAIYVANPEYTPGVTNSKTLNIRNTDFTSNSATENGGAIYIEGTGNDITITNTDFIYNTAQEGAAIYNNGTDNLKFVIDSTGHESYTIGLNTGNSSIYTRGDIYFDLAADKEYMVEGIKMDTSKTIYVNQSGSTGTLEFMSPVLDLEGNDGHANISLHAGNFEYCGDDTATFGSFNALGGKIAFDDGCDTSSHIVISELKGNGGTTVGVDFNASDGSMDRITVNGVNGTTSLTLNKINVINDGNASSATYLDGTARNSVNVVSNPINVTTTSGITYTFTPVTSNHGLLTVTSNASPLKTLPEAIADSTISNYSFTGNYSATSDLGTLEGDNRDFAIFGNGYILNGNNHNGITVKNGDKLSIEGFSGNSTSSVQNFTYSGFLGGGVICSEGTVNIQSSSFVNNTSQGMGGVIAKLGGQLEIGDNVTFYGNRASDSSVGGVIANVNGTVTIGDNVEFGALNRGNSAGYGGAIANESVNPHDPAYNPDSGRLSIGNNVKFIGNSAAFDGGGIDALGTIVIGNNAIITNNTAGVKGGFISNYSPLTVGTSAQFKANTADRGGAVFNWGENSSIGEGAVFTANRATRYGGAIANMYDYEKTDVLPHLDISITLNGATFGDGTAANANTANYGGAIANTETLRINGGTTFNYNHALEGAAIYNFSSQDSNGVLYLNADDGDITFRNNISTNNKGGAIYNDNIVNFAGTGSNKIVFENESDTIYNTGTLNFNSGNVEINSGIYDANTKTGVMNIRGANVTLSNTSPLNQKTLNVESGSIAVSASNLNLTDNIVNTATVTLTGGTLNKSISAEQNNESNIVNITNAPVTLNAQLTNQNIVVSSELVNNKTQDYIGNTNNLTLDGRGALNLQDANMTMNTVSLNNFSITNNNNAGLKFDTDFANTVQDTDKINIAGTASGNVNLRSVNVKSAFDGDLGTTRTIQLFEGGNLTNLTLGTARTSTGQVAYEFTQGENKGELLVTKVFGYTLPETIGKTGANADVGTFSLTNDLIMTEDLGTLQRNDAGEPREFTINGNNYQIDGQNQYGGITVRNGDTLHLEDINGFQNYSTAVTNSGTTSLNNVIFEDNTTDVLNYGTLNIVGNTELSGGITGNGDTNVSAVLDVGDGKVSQNRVTINENGELISSAEKIISSNGIENNGRYTVSGGTNSNKITGTGTTYIDGTVVNNAEIISALTVNENKQLTSNANNIKGYVTNNGTLFYNGGTNTATVAGSGTLNISNPITNTANITQNQLSVSSSFTNNGQITVSQVSLDNDVIGVGTLSLSGVNDISERRNTITQQTVTNTGNLTSKAGQINAAVVNNSSYTLVGGEDVTLSNNADISGNGTTYITHSVKNDGNISQNVVNSGTLTSSADNISGVVTNNGQYNISGGTIASSITGEGTIELSGEVTSNYDVSAYSGNVTLAENGKLILGSGSLFTGANKFNASNNSTISILNSANDNIVFSNLAVNGADTANIEIDWRDTINSTNTDNIVGSVNLSKINLANQTATDNYVVTNFTDKLIVDMNKLSLITDENSTNFINYNSTTGSLSTKTVNSLENAVTNSEQGVNMYVLSGDENPNNSSLTAGDLIVDGVGNAITATGITVGDGTATNITLTLKDTDISNVQINGVNQGAITVRGSNSLVINAENGDITMSGTTNLNGDNNAIYLLKDGDNTSSVTLNAEDNKITINDDIRSNSVDNTINFTGNDVITLNGNFDPATANVSSNVVRGGSNVHDESITYNLNNGGYLQYLDDKILYEAGYHDVNNYYNTINFNGGSLDLRNSTISTIRLDNLAVNANSNLYLDVDLRGNNISMDKFEVNNPVTAAVGSFINVAGMNIMDDNSSTSQTINFTNDAALMGAINFATREIPGNIYRYSVSYDNTSGNFNFANTGAFTPSVLSAPVAAQLGSFIAQVNSYDQAFTNMDMMMLMPKEQRTAMKYANKYAANTDDETLSDNHIQTPKQGKGIWFRPYATFENVQLSNGGPKVGNNLYGTFVGGDTDIISLKHGWDVTYSGYVGYNGSHQTYNGISIYQNGAQLGASAVFYKNNFFTGLTANVGANFANASNSFGKDNFTQLTAGAASKTGYNWELADSKFIIQPNFLFSYTFVNTFDYNTANGVRITSDPLNALQISPGLKFIGNFRNGWQPYLGTRMIWNIMDNAKYYANDVNLPELSVHPYFEYGLGLQKRFGSVFTASGETMFRNGGRNGVVLNLGLKWALGTKKTFNE